MRNCNMPGPSDRRCGCTPEPAYIRPEYVPGMAYVPWQYFTTVYDADKALERGTLFPELDKPFMPGRRCLRR